MTQSDVIQQLTRILGFILTPLLIKWGIDEGSTGIIITGAGGLLGVFAWWFFWNRKKA